MKPSSIAEDVVVAACIAALGVTFALLIIFCKRRRRRRRSTSILRAGDDNDDNSVAAMLPPPTALPLSDIEAATGGFHPSRIIGRGSLGVAYRAASAVGDVFVAKRMHPHLVLGNPGDAGFSAKIKHLSQAGHHPNLVPVLGYSEAPGERIVVYGYAGGRTLDERLHVDAAARGPPLQVLDWAARLRIAAGAARGIEHLHEGAAPGVVHGRVKPSNVVVDEESLEAKVCDYGLAALFGGRGGMEGYVDGEGRRHGGPAACKENDVYGFGVVLLELLSGRRSEGGKVVEWAVPLIRAGRVGEVLDPRLGAPGDMGPLLRMAKVASACVGNGRKSRPTMAQVAAILSSLEVQPCV